MQLAFVGLALTLDAQGLLRYHASKTPAECAREARLTREDRERLRSLVRALYAHVFGGHPLAADDYRRWRDDIAGPGMRQRTELALGAGLLLALAVSAGVVGLQQARLSDADPRRSTYLAGPSGARAFAEALERLGVRVQSFRLPTAEYDTLVAPRTLTPFIDPSTPLDAREGLTVAGLRTDLLVAGAGAAAALRCLGWDRLRAPDSMGVIRPPGAESRRFPRPGAILVQRKSPVAVDSAEGEDSAPVRCTAPRPRMPSTRCSGPPAAGPVVVRAALDDGRTVTLAADGRLFANRVLRETAAGPFVLGLVVPRYDRVVVDEYHHGFDASRSLSAADARLDVPVAVGLGHPPARGRGRARAAGRGRPLRADPLRDRAPPALAARTRSGARHRARRGPGPRGRHRTDRAGAPAPALVHGAEHPGEIGPWLESLGRPCARRAAGRRSRRSPLVTHRPASADDVLLAADAVETLWEEFTPT